MNNLIPKINEVKRVAGDASNRVKYFSIVYCLQIRTYLILIFLGDCFGQVFDVLRLTLVIPKSCTSSDQILNTPFTFFLSVFIEYSLFYLYYFILLTMNPHIVLIENSSTQERLLGNKFTDFIAKHSLIDEVIFCKLVFTIHTLY
mgnify:CR=1 FL=1